MTVEVWRRSRLHPLEEVGGEVAFGERRQDDDDQLAGHLGPRADLEGGGQRGAGRDADGQALDRRGRPRGAERGVVADAHDLVDQRGLEIVRHEAGADALDLVRAGLAAGEHGAVLDRKSVVSGKRVYVRVDLGGRRLIKKKKNSK